MTTVTNLIQEVELYLEGVKIPTFSSISISEQENTIPAAQVSFATNDSILRVLPGTLLQVFVKMKTPNQILTKEKREVENHFLIFEGQVSQMSYSRGTDAESVSLNAVSLLSETQRATLRPGHALITSARNDAELNHITKIRLSNSLQIDGKDVFSKNSKVNKDESTLYTKDKDYYEGTINQLKEIATFGDIANTMATEFTKPGSEMSTGNYIEFFREMNRFFMQADIYYGVQSLSYKLGQSILAFPNKASGFDLKVAMQAMNNMYTTMNQFPTGTQQVHILMNLINQFTQVLGYKYICPASPLAVKYFHITNDSLNLTRPLRMFFMPDMESGPPPLCNIFFPEQVNSISFSRDFISEPTRVIGQLTYSFLNGALPAYMMPITVVPDVNVHRPKDATSPHTISSKYTDEESYRGVVLKVSEYDGAIITALYDHKNLITVGDKKNIQPLNEEDKKEVHPSLRKFLINDYLSMKYGQRAVQIEAEWNPYRIVGLPAMFFEIGKPTLLGIIASASTQLHANGRAMSSYTLRNVRILFDEEPSDSPFLSVPFEKRGNNDKLDSYVISDFVNSGCLGANPLMYEPQYYSMENIGKEVYPYLITGKMEQRNLYNFFSKSKRKYCINNALNAKKKGKESFAEFTINYDTDKYQIKEVKILEEKVKNIIKEMKNYINNKTPIKIYLDGYRDWLGTEKHSNTLSKNRAEFAKKYLETHFPTAKFIVLSRSEDPKGFVGDNDTAEGRALNKRTVIKVVKEEEAVVDYSIIRYLDMTAFKAAQAGSKDSLEVYNTKMLYQAIKAFKAGYYKPNNPGNILDITYRDLLKKQDYLNSINPGLRLDDTSFEGWVSNSKDLQHILQNKDLSYSQIRQILVELDDLFNHNDIAKTSYSNENDAKSPSKKQINKLISEVEKLLKEAKKRKVALEKTIKKEKKEHPSEDKISAELELEVNAIEIEDLTQKIADIKAGIVIDINDSIKLRKIINSILVQGSGIIKPESVQSNTSLFRPFNTTRRAHVQEIIKRYNYLKISALEENPENPSNLIMSK